MYFLKKLKLLLTIGNVCGIIYAVDDVGRLYGGIGAVG